MSFNRFDSTPARVSTNQTSQRTTQGSTFGSRFAAGMASGAALGGVAAVHSTYVLQSFGLSPAGADQVVKGSPVTSKADQLAILDTLRKAKALGSADLQTSKLSNFEIQALMAAYNQAEMLASNVLKKKDDTDNATVNKIG